MTLQKTYSRGRGSKGVREVNCRFPTVDFFIGVISLNRASKQPILVREHELFSPELVSIENVGDLELSGDPTATYCQ